MDNFKINVSLFFSFATWKSFQQPSHRDKTMALVHDCMGNRYNRESNVPKANSYTSIHIETAISRMQNSR